MPKTTSEMMIKLYGAEEAEKVAARCDEVDPWFGQYVNRVIYEEIWRLPPLSFFEKSLATIIALASLKKEEQLQIHIKGFYNLGGSFSDLTTIFNFMAHQGYIKSPETALALASSIKITSQPERKESIFNEKNQAIINLASLIALGNNENTQKFLEELLPTEILSEDEIRGVLRHIMVYCGCPCSMNGFGLLNTILKANLTIKCKL